MMGSRLAPGTTATSMLHMLADGSCLTIEDMQMRLGLSARQVSDGASKLFFRKWMNRAQRGCYQLSDEGIEAARAGAAVTSGPTGPATGLRKAVANTFREKAWRAMRVRGTFSIADIAADAESGEKNPHNNANRYIRYLVMAGYVIELAHKRSGTRLTSNGFKSFRLVRNSGPRAPVYSPKKHAMHDFNIREDVPCKSK